MCRVYSDWLRLDVLWNVGFIANGYWRTDWEFVVVMAIGYCGRGVERSCYSYWLLVDVLWSVKFIATGYWWSGW